MKILSIILIAVSLSMDTFSLALSVGTSLTKRKDILFLSSLVGVFHFFMPLLGNAFGNEIKQIFNINPNLLLFYLFMFIAIEMVIDLFSKSEKAFSLSLWQAILFAFSVSLDSFTIGIGLKSIINDIIFASFIFMIISAFFTYFYLISTTNQAQCKTDCCTYSCPPPEFTSFNSLESRGTIIIH